MSEEDRRQLPAPGWSALTQGFWLAAGRGELVVQRCSDCGAHRWPPAWACYACQSTLWRWHQLAGIGTVFTYTWADQRAPSESPLYNVSIVEIEGTQGEPVRLMTQVVDISRDELRCGLEVEVTFEQLDDEVAVPMFRPRS